jgi:hypothetical protein
VIWSGRIATTAVGPIRRVLVGRAIGQSEGVRNSTGIAARPAANVATALLFGVPGTLLFLVVAIGYSYGGGGPVLFAYSAVLLIGVLLVGLALTSQRRLTYALAFSLLVASAITLGTLTG